MGTFHQNKHELHGITVVVDTEGPEVYIGRCDDMDDSRVLLVDVDVHRDGENGVTKQDWIRKAAAYGVWKKFDRLVVDRTRVTSVERLGEI